jgi:hypothetical protein
VTVWVAVPQLTTTLAPASAVPVTVTPAVFSAALTVLSPATAFTTGVVETITSESGSKSGQLAQALADGKKIIVCTIQTFPFALAEVRRLAATRKVGHAGTLDPMATGVLLVGIERATRLLGHLTLADVRPRVLGWYRETRLATPRRRPGAKDGLPSQDLTAPSSVRNEIRFLGQAIRWAQVEELLPPGPAPKVPVRGFRWVNAVARNPKARQRRGNLRANMPGLTQPRHQHRATRIRTINNQLRRPRKVIRRADALREHTQRSRFIANDRLSEVCRQRRSI